VRFAAAIVAAMIAHSALADTTIRMWTFLDPAGNTPREKVLRELIDSFEAENPGVKIVVEPQVWQQLTDKFLAATQTDTAPDVVWIHHTRIIEAIRLGVLANLNELFAKDWSADDFNDVDDALWRFGATPDAHYHLMLSRSMRGQFYRVDLFEKAGIDPKSLTSWDKFTDAAQKLTEKDANGNVVRWGYGQSFPTQGANSPLMSNVLLDLQGHLFDEEGRADWATPEGVQALTHELDMITKHGVTPDTAISMKDDDVYDQFNAGRMAIIRGGTARVPRAIAALGVGNVGYLRTPSMKGDGYARAELIGWAVAVWNGSRNVELAGKWLDHLTNRKADTLWATEAGMIPIRKSTVANNPEFFSRPENAYLAVAAEEVENGWLPPEGVPGGYNDALNRAAQDVLVNGMDPMEALQKAEDEFNRHL
jgi:multiple sugar transport system substrate-binding protein